MLVCRRVISSTFSAVLGLSDDSRDGDYVPGSHTAVASTSGASPSKQGRWSHSGRCAGMTTRSAASPISGFEGEYSFLPLSLYRYLDCTRSNDRFCLMMGTSWFQLVLHKSMENPLWEWIRLLPML